MNKIVEDKLVFQIGVLLEKHHALKMLKNLDEHAYKRRVKKLNSSHENTRYPKDDKEKSLMDKKIVPGYIDTDLARVNVCVAVIIGFVLGMLFMGLLVIIDDKIDNHVGAYTGILQPKR